MTLQMRRWTLKKGTVLSWLPLRPLTRSVQRDRLVSASHNRAVGSVWSGEAATKAGDGRPPEVGFSEFWRRNEEAIFNFESTQGFLALLLPPENDAPDLDFNVINHVLDHDLVTLGTDTMHQPSSKRARRMISVPSYIATELILNSCELPKDEIEGRGLLAGITKGMDVFNFPLLDTVTKAPRVFNDFVLSKLDTVDYDAFKGKYEDACRRRDNEWRAR